MCPPKWTPIPGFTVQPGKARRRARGYTSRGPASFILVSSVVVVSRKKKISHMNYFSLLTSITPPACTTPPAKIHLVCRQAARLVALGRQSWVSPFVDTWPPWIPPGPACMCVWMYVCTLLAKRGAQTSFPPASLGPSWPQGQPAPWGLPPARYALCAARISSTCSCVTAPVATRPGANSFC